MGRINKTLMAHYLTKIFKNLIIDDLIEATVKTG